MYMYMYIYIYIYNNCARFHFAHKQTEPNVLQLRKGNAQVAKPPFATPGSPTNIVDFRGFGSNII